MRTDRSSLRKERERAVPSGRSTSSRRSREFGWERMGGERMGGAFGQSWVGSRAISEVFPLARAHQIYKVRWTTKEHIPRVAPRNELHRGRDRPVGELRGQTATAIAPGGKTSAKAHRFESCSARIKTCSAHVDARFHTERFSGSVDWVRLPGCDLFSSRHVVRAVKELDSKSIGLCPRRFESCTCRERPPPGFSSVGRAVDCSGVHTDSINWSPVRFR